MSFSGAFSKKRTEPRRFGLLSLIHTWPTAESGSAKVERAHRRHGGVVIFVQKWGKRDRHGPTALQSSEKTVASDQL
jgi:hypothetical protein